jgi:protein subunit release factor A
MSAESASKQQTYNYTQKEILDHMIHDSKILDQRMNPVELKELEAYYWNLQYIHGK